MEPLSPSWGTVKEAAELSGLHSMTIRRYIKAGDLPARRVGVKLIQVDLDAVRAMVRPMEATVVRSGVYASLGAEK